MIQGERVILRPIQETDTEDVLRMRSDPSVLAQLFSERPPTAEEHLQWLKKVRLQGDREEFIIVERSTGRSLGTIGLSQIDKKNHRAEFGILIGQDSDRRQGFAIEAARLLLDYSIKKLALHRIYLHVFSDNMIALNFYEKLGFCKEGVLHHHIFKDGEFQDVLVMAQCHEG